MTAAVQPLSYALATDLLSTYGSPLYVYDADRLQATLNHITQAIPYPHTQFRFASVTNGNIAVLKQFRAVGWGLHANTPGDIYLGLQAGFNPDQMVYSGSNLNREDMAQVMDWGVTVLNLDSLSQVQLCGEVYADRQQMGNADWLQTGCGLRLGLRLNQPELTGESRIGVRPEEFEAAIALARQFNLQINGLHFYRGTGTNATEAFTQVIDRVIAIGQTLPDWSYLDFGGGFGYPYHHGSLAFNWPEFGTALRDRLHHLNKHRHPSAQPLELVIEPGRAAIAGCATLLARVVSVKWQGDKQIVGVDTTVANLSVPAVHGGYRQIIALLPDQPTAPTSLPSPVPTDICGNTTYSRDYLGKNCPLPQLQIGDLVSILDVGAYGYAMSSHFLHRPRPAEVLLEHGQHRLIRQREDYSVLLLNQVVDPAIA